LQLHAAARAAKSALLTKQPRCYLTVPRALITLPNHGVIRVHAKSLQALQLAQANFSAAALAIDVLDANQP